MFILNKSSMCEMTNYTSKPYTMT